MCNGRLVTKRYGCFPSCIFGKDWWPASSSFDGCASVAATLFHNRGETNAEMRPIFARSSILARAEAGWMLPLLCGTLDQVLQ